MREHRKSLHRKRGRLLVLSKSWMTRFGGFRSFNRQNVSSKRHINTSAGLKNIYLCRGGQLGSRVPGLITGETSRKNPLKRLQRFHRSHSFRRGFQRKSSERLLQTKTLLSHRVEKEGAERNVLNNDAETNTRTLQIKEVFQTPKHADKSNRSLVILNSLRRTPLPSLNQKYFGGKWLMRRCSLFSREKVPLFMMHKKLSVFTGCGRIQSQKLRAKNRSIKFVDINRPRIQRAFWSLCRKSIRDKFRRASSYLKSIILRPAQGIRRLSDMNSSTSGILCETQQSTTSCCLKDESVKVQNIGQIANVSSKSILKINQNPLNSPAADYVIGESIAKQTGDIPAVNSYTDDVYILLTEKEISVTCQEDADVHGEESDELLAPDKLQLCVNEHVGCQGNISMEMVESNEDSCHMDQDESTNSDVFNTKLLDHPYCKSSPQDSSHEGALDVPSKQGAKNGQNIISRVPDEQLASCLCGLLNEIITKYGSLIPLSEKDVLTRLKEVFNEDFSNRTSFISKEITKYRARHSKATMCNFRVFYNKHMLDMDDLATLDGQNWLNDQVINMYGELIMDAVPDKVHFLNSFFHRQLVTKGYNGVKRWTKKVDFFKKTLLLIPIHLEVHWSLITVNIPNKIISFYDSQGIHFKFCVENIRKYLLTEAREKNHPEFLQGWQTAVTKCIPLQKNDSDCGVFVLQYCKCLALEQPFQFSQEDMPRVRKRIYKELCECRLMD